MFKKRANKELDEEIVSHYGDAWVFVGIERSTKLVLAFELGKRTVTSATRFMRKLSAATDPNQKFQLTTDGLPAYPLAVGNILGHQGERVDYAQLVKIYRQQIPEELRRYSPPRLAEAIPTPIYLKRKINETEGFTQLYEKIVQLRMESSDGKLYLTDTANSETLLRIIQSIPHRKAEPFKRWLAKVGYERIQEIYYHVEVLKPGEMRRCQQPTPYPPA